MVYARYLLCETPNPITLPSCRQIEQTHIYALAIRIQYLAVTFDKMGQLGGLSPKGSVAVRR